MSIFNPFTVVFRLNYHRKEYSNKNLSSQYAVSVFNTLQEPPFYLESDNIDTIYNTLIVANEEVALSTLPKKEKSPKSPISADAGVLSRREKLKGMASLYHFSPSRASKVK